MEKYTIVATRSSATIEPLRHPTAIAARGTGGPLRLETFDPVELLLAAVAAAVLRGTEQAASVMHFRLTDAAVSVHGWHVGAEYALTIAYDLLLATDETDARLFQFHETVRRSDSLDHLGVVGRDLTGSLRRRIA